MIRMVAVRIHGRGGQGVVTAAELLSVAGFRDGLEAQAVPSFGSERMGAPVAAYCRLSADPIRTREPVSEPDVVIVADATLLHHVDVFAGLRPDGYAVLNSAHTIDELGLADLTKRMRRERIRVVPATDLARQYTGSPRPNICLLGAFAAATGLVSMAGIEQAVRARLSAPVAQANLAAAQAAYRLLQQRVGTDA
jgi:pyruvate ferredoxin oxidoreductase gamma subunit